MQTAKIILLPYVELINRAGVPALCGQRCTPPLRRLFIFALGAILTIALQLPAQAQALQVLHWWKSAGEHKAVDLLASRLAQENILWRDAVIPSGSGIGAGIVLKSRVLAGTAPEVAQLNGVAITEWADLGLLLEFDAVGTSGKWDKLVFPLVWNLVQPRGHVVAAPLGIHRINTLFFNRKLFSKYDLAVPESWDEFEHVAKKLQQAGVIPLAQSSEPWQVATLFETLLLSEGGAGFYSTAFVKKDPAAFYDQRFARALMRLRALKKYMPLPLQERAWSDMARQLADGGAAMLVMGDFVKGELNALGLVTDIGFGCTAVPETANYHLYDIDTLVMLSKDNNARVAQEKLAQIVMSPALQADYNQIKGSIPVLRNPDLTKMDSCSRASWKLFSRGSAVQVPSLAHRMATDELSRDAIVAEIHRFFMDDQITAGEVQRRLGAIARSLPKPKAGNDAQDTNR
ncbi:ABC transporter substrate-binding protein [soil metagenome]